MDIRVLHGLISSVEPLLGLSPDLWSDNDRVKEIEVKRMS